MYSGTPISTSRAAHEADGTSGRSIAASGQSSFAAGSSRSDLLARSIGFGMRFLVLLLLLTTGCRDFAVDGGDDASASRARSFDVEANTPFEIGVGDEAFLADADMTVTFSFVTEDSRCQSSNPCDGPGRAGVLLDISRGIGDDSQILLVIPGLVPTPYRLNDFVQHREERFQLLELGPYPDPTGNLQSRDYTATILIDR